MKKIAKSGGVVGIGFWANVTCDDSPRGVAGAIRAAVDLLGEDHVSLGSDWDGTVQVAIVPSDLPALTQALMKEGLSEAQISKIMGAISYVFYVSDSALELGARFTAIQKLIGKAEQILLATAINQRSHWAPSGHKCHLIT